MQCGAAIGPASWQGAKGILDEEKELPDDLDNASVYATVPDKHELDLGLRMVFRFVSDHAPDVYDQLRDLFNRRGAYGRYKDLLERRGLLEAWYQYEQKAIRDALNDWAEAEGLEGVEGARGTEGGGG